MIDHSVPDFVHRFAAASRIGYPGQSIVADSRLDIAADIGDVMPIPKLRYAPGGSAGSIVEREKVKVGSALSSMRTKKAMIALRTQGKDVGDSCLPWIGYPLLVNQLHVVIPEPVWPRINMIGQAGG